MSKPVDLLHEPRKNFKLIHNHLRASNNKNIPTVVQQSGVWEGKCTWTLPKKNLFELTYAV